MNKIKRVLKISKAEIDKWNRLMQADSVNYDAEGIPGFSCVKSWSESYGDGYEIDLKVCSGDSACSDPLWCETVLFHNGCEIECSELYDDLGGSWMLRGDGINFILDVVEK